MSVRDDRPTSYDDLCTRLAADLETMPKRLAQTASYLVAHPDEVAFGTTASIAEGAGVQPSTLIRFAKANGFEGFSDLQLLFRERLRDRNQSYDSRLATLGQDADQVPSRAVLNGFIAAGQESLAWLQRDMDLDQFDAAAALLARAGTVYLVARRRAFPPLIQLRYALAKLGIRSEICGSVNGIDNDLLAFAGPGDAAILISFAPTPPRPSRRPSSCARRRCPSWPSPTRACHRSAPGPRPGSCWPRRIMRAFAPRPRP